MTECIRQLALSFHPQAPVVVEFDAPEISSDGGALLLRQVDARLGLTASLAACLSENREPSRIRHSRQEQVRQRIFQIALGYEDCNDADSLRQDPLLKTVCDRTPRDPQGLSSQPTLSRFENAQEGQTLRRLLEFFEDSYVTSLPADTQQVILDIDSTDDETHGAQQLSFFSGFHGHSMYHPLLVFDGESGQLVSVLLRPGNAHASRGAAGLLRRLIAKIKQRFPQAQIVAAGTSGPSRVIPEIREPPSPRMSGPRPCVRDAASILVLRAFPALFGLLPCRSVSSTPNQTGIYIPGL